MQQKNKEKREMKEQTEKQVTYSFYTKAAIQELLTLAMAGDRDAAGEIIARQERAAAEIEQLKVKVNSKTRAPRAEKTPIDLARDNAYFRTALLVKQFGAESVDLQVLTAASAYLDCGLAQGNLRQAYNRVQQVIRAQAVTEEVFPEWVITAASEIPQLDENKKLEEEGDKVEQIKNIIRKYIETQETPTQETPAQETPAQAAPANKKGGKK